MKVQECPVCGSNNTEVSFADPLNTLIFISCPTCGRFELKNNFDIIDYGSLDKNQLSSYLFYHHFLGHASPTEYRYHSIISKEICDTYKANFENGDICNGNPVHMDDEIINAWYPKSFDERVNYIIKYLGEHIPHVGQAVCFSFEETLSLLFIDRYEKDSRIISTTNGELIARGKAECTNEARYMLESLKVSGLISYSFLNNSNTNLYMEINLTPKGYSQVDKIQRNTNNGKQVLVAMKFGDETKILRESIRSGISNAGYIAVFIDEVQHNDFITPELLKHIRDSKFVVVDLTHQNNGAYFEEGYAMGLGKPVIQLCKQDTKLHFDIAQKNTIIWQSEDDIPEMLCNRIKATID